MARVSPADASRRLLRASRSGSLLLIMLEFAIGWMVAALALAAVDERGKSVEPVAAPGGTTSWKCDGPLTFRPVTPVKAAEGTIYLEVSYLDKGYGRLRVRWLDPAKQAVAPDRYLGLARSDSGKWVAARMRFRGVVGDGSVRIEPEKSGEEFFIQNVTIQATPFDDPHFRYIISDPWAKPYEGPHVDAGRDTLKGKVMVGYQGWFRTPNDPYGTGWRHWGNIEKCMFTIDMWPDLSHYPASTLEKAADVKLKSGKQAYLFSSAWPEVADLHFRWMREHEIDGAFVQRFVSDDFNTISGKSEWVLANARAAAHREGRIWAVEYDVSGYPDAKLLATLKADWKWMVDTFGVRNDRNYAHENGKPVVFIWGMPFPDRNISSDTANAVVDFFENDPNYGGNYVIGGIPNNWRKLGKPWQDHITKYPCVLSWMSENYANDVVDLGKLGIAYDPHVRPGFSWANLKHLPTGDLTLAYTPRDGGKFYWNQISKAVASGADRLFVGMLDEYDEGTAILPMSDDPPPTPSLPGVAATFYDGLEPREHGQFRRVPQAEFGLDKDHFFVRLGGEITFPETGDYTFTVEGAAGDDAFLTVGGKKCLEVKNLGGASEPSAKISAKAGESMPFRLDYRHRTGSGTVRFLWERVGHGRSAVPQEALRDAWGRFIGNEGQPPDHWLRLTKAGKEMLKGNRPVDSEMP